MSLHILYGTAGTGKTQKCMDILNDGINKYEKIFYIVPEQFSYTAEELVTEKFGAVSPAVVEVSSFKRLYFQMINYTGDAGLKKLTIGGKTILLNYICMSLKDRLQILSKTASFKGFAEIITKLLSEFKTYNATPETLNLAYDKLTGNDKLTLKLQDLYLIYSVYCGQIKDKFEDADDELGILSSLIKCNPEVYANSLFIFDGFSGFTPQETEVIASLMGCSQDIYFAFTSDSLDISGEHDIFSMQKKNIKRILACAEIAGMEIASPQKLELPIKFEKSPEIGYLISSLATHSYKKYPSEVHNIRISSHNHQYDEIEYAAEEITKLIRPGKLRYRDILIIARDSGRYLPVIRKIFDSFEIPVFIADKVNAASQPAVSAIISALDIITENFSYETVFSYLKSGFANLEYDELDLLENYIIATGIRGTSWTSDKYWHYTPYAAKDFDFEDEFLKTINFIRRKFVVPVKSLKDKLEESKTIRGKCAALYEFIAEINLFERISGMIERFKNSNPQTASYYGQVWNIIINTLDEIVEILGDTEMDINEFKEIFITGLSVREIGVIPTTADVVTVSNAENAGGNHKIVFVVGANDGVYPSIMRNEGLLCDKDRITLNGLGVELARDTVSKAFDEDYIIYSVLSCATEKLFITYPVSDMGGGGRHPARIIRRCSELFDKLKAEDYIISPDIFGEEKVTRPKPTFTYFASSMRKEKDGSDYNQLWHDVGNWFKIKHTEKYKSYETAIDYTPSAAGIDEKLINDVFGDGVLKLSISRLELYKKCPFAHYARYMLRLEARQEARLEVTDTGSFMHEILEQLSINLQKKGYTWQSVPDDILITETEFLIDQKITEIENQFDYKSNRRIWMLARLKNTLLASTQFVAKHLRAGEFIPLGYEIEFDDNQKYTPLIIDLGGKKIKLRGKIDRADIYINPEGERYIRVIDYKSGSRSFDIGQMYYGLQLQLAVYLDRLCDLENANPAGILYFRLHDPNVALDADATNEEIEKALECEYKMQGLVLADNNIVSAMDKNIQGSSSIIPVKYLKSGEFDRFSSVASVKQFGDMRKKLHNVLRQLGKEICGGNSSISPVKYNNMTGCDYCDFKDVCHFETGCGSKFNVLKQLPKQDIWNEIEKEGEADA